MSIETEFGPSIDPHGVITNGKWNPTPKQMAAFKERDLQLAVHNLRAIRKEFRLNHQTLHAPTTQIRAAAMLDEKEALLKP